MRDAMGQHRDWGPGVMKVIGSVSIGAMRDIMHTAHQVVAAGCPGFLGAR